MTKYSCGLCSEVESPDVKNFAELSKAGWHGIEYELPLRAIDKIVDTPEKRMFTVAICPKHKFEELGRAMAVKMREIRLAEVL